MPDPISSFQSPYSPKRIAPSDTPKKTESNPSTPSTLNPTDHTELSSPQKGNEPDITPEELAGWTQAAKEVSIDEAKVAEINYKLASGEYGSHEVMQELPDRLFEELFIADPDET